MNAAAEHTRRILVVEDDPHLAAGVVENLRAEGYDVDSVTDGRQALEWLQGRSCGLVLLDVMLPEIDGFAVCRTLRERGDSTPVLFLTARGDPADRVRGLEAGGDDYLAKPFHLRELLLRVRAIYGPGCKVSRIGRRDRRGARAVSHGFALTPARQRDYQACCDSPAAIHPPAIRGASQ